MLGQPHRQTLDLAERATLAAERRIPDGLAGAVDRLIVATGGAATTLTQAQADVLTLLAFEVCTVRDLCAARGFSSTNAAADHLSRLKLRGLICRTAPAAGRAYRYAPWSLTSAGWRVLGPCDHILRMVAAGTWSKVGERFHMDATITGAPIAFCPWCGWRLW